MKPNTEELIEENQELKRRIKAVIDYAHHEGHGVKNCDMYHPVCIACRIVDILEG